MMTVDEAVIAACDPGIRDIVRLLQAHGFETCDSGDGSKAGDMGCALPYPHVFVQSDVDLMIGDAEEIKRVLPEWDVECNWKVGVDIPAFICVSRGAVYTCHCCQASVVFAAEPPPGSAACGCGLIGEHTADPYCRPLARPSDAGDRA